jgi:hypothetical protein
MSDGSRTVDSTLAAIQAAAEAARRAQERAARVRALASARAYAGPGAFSQQLLASRKPPPEPPRPVAP